MTLRSELPERLEPLRADPALLEELLRRLVHNALRFTRGGSVTVTVTPRRERTGRCGRK